MSCEIASEATYQIDCYVPYDICGEISCEFLMGFLVTLLARSLMRFIVRLERVCLRNLVRECLRDGLWDDLSYSVL